LELALQASKIVIWEWDIPSNTLTWSKELRKIFKYDLKAPVTYEDYQKFLHPDDRSKINRHIQQSLKDGKRYSVEHRIIWPDGSVHWLLGQGQAFFKNGKPVRMTGSTLNIDQQIAVRQKIKESDERYQAFIKNSNEGIWRVELDEPIPINVSTKKQIDLMYEHAYMAEANRAMAAMYGFKSPKPLIGARLGDLLVRDDPTNTEYLTKFIKSGYSLVGHESHEKDKDGNDKYFRNSLVGTIENGYIVRAWGTQQDITEQTHAKIQLEESEQRFRTMADSAPILMWESGPDRKCTYFNKGWLSYTGRSLDQEIGEGWRQTIHPDDLQKITDVYYQAFEARRPYTAEYRIRRADGKYRWIIDNGVPRFSSHGRFLGFIGSCTDVHDLKQTKSLEQKTALLRKQRAQLLSLNKAKDEFISLASHQLRTPATAVKQYIGMLREGYAGKLTTKQQALLLTAYSSNERQLQIINDLLKVANIDAGKITLKKERVDIVSLMQRIVSNHNFNFKQSRQTVVFIPEQEQIVIKADVSRLSMALENLIDNAHKYTSEGKKIYIEIENFKTGVKIKIRDEGVGIANEDVAKLFQKFSRIDNARSTLVGGSGLGLYIAKSIVDLHRGTIVVSSVLKAGTTFTVILP
jgi:PAS domain S-box-containing protein